MKKQKWAGHTQLDKSLAQGQNHSSPGTLFVYDDLRKLANNKKRSSFIDKTILSRASEPTPFVHWVVVIGDVYVAPISMGIGPYHTDTNQHSAKKIAQNVLWDKYIFNTKAAKIPKWKK